VKLVAWCKEDDALLEGAPPGPLVCPDCKKEYALHAADKLETCFVCGYAHFHLRKDFPRALGLMIVLAAFLIGVSNTIVPPQLFFVPLIVASLIDFGLYYVLPWKVVCYVCDAEYRGANLDPAWKPYDLHVATECKRLRWPRPSGSPAPAA